jgi:hypothetical protein
MIAARALSIIHNPIVDSRGTKLSQALGWHDPDALARDYIRDVREASHGRVNYQIAERVEVDGFPVKLDGFRYDVNTYLRCWRERRGFHQPDAVDYLALIREFKMIEKVEADQIDEVWLFAFPYAGYYESTMCGRGAFWCNSPPVPQTEGGRRRFVIMGFNYERDVGCMLEDLGHRAESIMAKVFEGRRGEANLWERFSRYDQIAPGRAAVGNMHFAPNSVRDYDWGNPRNVPSDCDDWLNFPNLTSRRRSVNCRDWGNGDMRRHHLWWFERIPHADGETARVSNNWWTYIIDPHRVP